MEEDDTAFRMMGPEDQAALLPPVLYAALVGHVLTGDPATDLPRVYDLEAWLRPEDGNGVELLLNASGADPDGSLRRGYLVAGLRTVPALGAALEAPDAAAYLAAEPVRAWAGIKNVLSLWNYFRVSAETLAGHVLLAHRVPVPVDATPDWLWATHARLHREA